MPYIFYVMQESTFGSDIHREYVVCNNLKHVLENVFSVGVKTNLKSDYHESKIICINMKTR